MIIPFNFPTKGIPYLVEANKQVNFQLPVGCALYSSSDLNTWQKYTNASPFIMPTPMHIRVDCEIFTTYVEAIVEL